MTRARSSLWDRIYRSQGEREMRAVGPEGTDRVPLPGTDQVLQITRPYPTAKHADEDDDYPERWVELWPAGIVLAGVIAREPWRLAGQRVLEIGPGAGVTAVAAMQAGAQLLVVDYTSGSLALTARNCLNQAGAEPETALLNWREPPAHFWTRVGDGFAVVLGADMLYRMMDARPLACFLERVVAVDGEVWITHAEREAAERLVEILRADGWQGPTEECARPLPDPQYETWDIIRIHRLRRPPRQ
jgi:predicted nicotinamide N-methyase